MRRKFLIIGATMILSAAAIVGIATATGGLPWQSAKESTAAAALPPATAKVTRATLVDTRTMSGTLGYGQPVPITASGLGTLTWIAPVGSTVKRNEPLYRVDERPVVVLDGNVPMYRTLREGLSGGSDVQQLKKNLAELGFSGITADGTYSKATAAAVRAWQAKLGRPQTGIVEPGEVVFTPGVIRIAEQTARVGDVLGGERGSQVLSYTSTTRLVTVDLPVTSQSLAVAGGKVTVKLPGRDAVLEGQISQIGTAARAAPTSPGAASEGSNPAASSGGSSAAAAQIQVTVAIADQNALGSLDTAPVDVDFVSETRANVLAVPVTALLARPEGGFGVEVVDGTRTRIVTVKTGMFAGGRVEVSGKGIAEGTAVGVSK